MYLLLDTYPEYKRLYKVVNKKQIPSPYLQFTKIKNSPSSADSIQYIQKVFNELVPYKLIIININ